MRGWLLLWEPEELVRDESLVGVRRGNRRVRFEHVFEFSAFEGRAVLFSNFSADSDHDPVFFAGRVNQGFSLRDRYPEGDFTRVWFDPGEGIEILCDQLGFQSFFWTEQRGKRIFSNSLEALCMCPEVDLVPRADVVASFLISNMVTRPDALATPFEGIHRSRPGSRWVIDGGGPRREVVWNLDAEHVSLRFPSVQEAAFELKSLLTDSIRDRLPMDGKTSLAQSGGLDSSLVGAIAHALGAEIKGFTISYDAIHQEEDWMYSKMVTEKFGWKQKRLVSDQIPFFRPEDWDLDLMRPSVLSATANLAEEMAGHSKVGLNGLSADNILAKGLPNWGRLSTFGTVLSRSLEHRGLPPLGIRKRSRQAVEFDSGVFPWIREDAFCEMNGLESFRSLADLPGKRYHPTHNYLAMSLERFNWTERFRERFDYQAFDPFFDIRLVRWSLSLDPFTYFYKKQTQRELARMLLPEAVANRKKTILGDVYSSVLKVTSPELVDRWELHPKLEGLVDRAQIPSLTQGNLSPMALFHATKPFWLNSWFVGLDRFLEFKNRVSRGELD